MTTLKTNTGAIITLLINKGEDEFDFLARCQEKALSVDYKKMDFDGQRCIIFSNTTLPINLKTCTQNNS